MHNCDHSSALRCGNCGPAIPPSNDAVCFGADADQGSGQVTLRLKIGHNERMSRNLSVYEAEQIYKSLGEVIAHAKNTDYRPKKAFSLRI